MFYVSCTVNFHTADQVQMNFHIKQLFKYPTILMAYLLSYADNEMSFYFDSPLM